MKNRIMLAIIASLMIMLGGCGSDDKDNTAGATGSSSVEMQKNKIIVNSNGLDFSLAVPFVKQNSSEVIAELKSFALEVMGCEIATVSYAPPIVLMDGNKDCIGRLYISGRFANICTPAGYSLGYTETVTLGGNSKSTPHLETYDYNDPNAGGSGPSEAGYSFYNATTPMQIVQPSTAYEIRVQLLLDTHPVAGKTVRLDAFSSSFGSVTKYDVTTGEDGYAIFNYTSPATLPVAGSYAPLNITFLDEDANATTPMAQHITLEFNSATGGGTGDDAGYSFINVTSLQIGQGSQKENIAAQLIYNNAPVVDKVVRISAFSSLYGSIANTYVVKTDSVGYAVFEYVAPPSIDDVNGTSVSLKMHFDENSTHLEQNISVAFEKKEVVIIQVGAPTVVVTVEGETYKPHLVLNENSKNISISVKVFKDSAVYPEGEVMVGLPDEAIKGSDVGIFASYSVPVNDQGIAIFSYTGPSNLLQTLTDENIDNDDSVFKFYHSEAEINASASLTIKYERPADIHVTHNYSLNISTSGEFSMGIPEQDKVFTVTLKAKDSNDDDTALTTESITSITVRTTNSTIAQILDTSDGSLKNELTLASGASNFTLRSKRASGLVPMEVTMVFVDINSDTKTLTTIVNTRVFSGPPSAISISYVSTDKNASIAKYIETFAISVTDEYGNPVNTRPNISLGAIAGYAVDGSELSEKETATSKRLFYGTSDINNGTANGFIDTTGDSDETTTEFNDTVMSNVFKYVNKEGPNTDKLVVFGASKQYEAMGKWDFSEIDDITLDLVDNYFGIDRRDLYYAVGHNYYQDQCRDDGREWIGTAESDTYQVDERGTAIVRYNYDYHLAGKDVMIWVNLDGIQPDTGKKTRIGEAVKHTLRTTGLTTSQSGGFSVAPYSVAVGTFYIQHDNEVPEYYRNAHFAYVSASTNTCKGDILATSNTFDARTCDTIHNVSVDLDNNSSTPDDVVEVGNTMGRAYVTYRLESTTDKACQFDIQGVAVASEF